MAICVELICVSQALYDLGIAHWITLAKIIKFCDWFSYARTKPFSYEQQSQACSTEEVWMPENLIGLNIGKKINIGQATWKRCNYTDIVILESAEVS